jgi:hypothetical protein
MHIYLVRRRASTEEERRRELCPPERCGSGEEDNEEQEGDEETRHGACGQLSSRDAGRAPFGLWPAPVAICQ